MQIFRSGYRRQNSPAFDALGKAFSRKCLHNTVRVHTSVTISQP